jgi:hypothetical protein
MDSREPRLSLLLLALAVGASSCSDESGTEGSSGDRDSGPAAGGDEGGAGVPTSVDPGTAEWEPVPRDQVADVCKLDPGLLEEADRALNVQWGIVRYGRLCHEFYPEGDAQITSPQQNWSATKTLAGVVTGIAAYETRDLPNTGRKTGPLSDMDRVDHWLDSSTFNPDAQIAHVLGMVAHNPSLAWGDKVFTYDAVGTTQINRLSDVVNTALAQDPDRLGANIEEFTQRFLFGPVGMGHSTWTDGAPDKNYAFSWFSPLRDMMRLGLLMLNEGRWDGKQILGADWLYRMTRPSFEDANPGYGYLTWLTARSDSTEACLPATIHAEYPHGLSEAADCNGLVAGVPTTVDCSQEHDVGVWSANGLNGQLIVGIKALDMVLVIKEGNSAAQGPVVFHTGFWPVVRPAVVALDPTYAGDDAAFCEAFDRNRYAPDLR